LRDRLVGLAPAERLALLNTLAGQAGLRTGSGQPLRFVSQVGAPSGLPYEDQVFCTGEVPTRTQGEGALHDLYNALMWLAWPRSKAIVNALHVREASGSAGQPLPTRGPLRDALTLFDEGGLVWACDQADLNQRLRDFQWQGLFVTARERVSQQVMARVFGHALLQKLEHPYKAITAHAWVLVTAPCDPASLDARLAAGLVAWGQSMPADRPGASFCPVPVLGLPGWWPPNEAPEFYRDERIFRPGRARRLQSPVERVGRSLSGATSAEEGPDSGGQGAG
jgi:hypothetical protein